MVYQDLGSNPSKLTLKQIKMCKNFRILYTPAHEDKTEMIYLLTDDGKMYSKQIGFIDMEVLVYSDRTYNKVHKKYVDLHPNDTYSKMLEMTWDEYMALQPGEYLQFLGNVAEQIYWVGHTLRSLDLTPENWDKYSYDNY